MSYNGSGTFQINTSGQPVVAGTVISATAFNALTADLATGLSTAITKDGQTTTTARIPFAAGINSTLTTDSSSTSTGSIITAGGVGVAKALYVGTTANVAGAVTLQSALSVTGVTTVQAGTALLPAITTTGDTNTGIFFPAADTIAFTEGGVEAMRIDSSGNLLVGTTDSPATLLTDGFAGVAISASDWLVASRFNNPAAYFKRENSDGEAVFFLRDATTVGSVSVTTTATSFNTSSDYRLKEDIAPMTGALAKVALLKPCTYKWKLNGSDGQGFIAHELQEVVEGCVTGEKDAVDADGNPKYQGIDTSFLVATLTAAIQELKALVDTQASTITALQADVAALKAK